MAKDQQYTRTVHCIVHSVYRVQLVFGEVQLEEEEEEEEEEARWSGGEYGLRQVITCFTAQPNPRI